MVTEKTKDHYSLEGLKEKLFEEVKNTHVFRFPYNDLLYEEYEEDY
ncbi:hypothetical protein [uncultured Flavobacterium sp.]